MIRADPSAARGVAGAPKNRLEYNRIKSYKTSQLRLRVSPWRATYCTSGPSRERGYTVTPHGLVSGGGAFATTSHGLPTGLWPALTHRYKYLFSR